MEILLNIRPAALSMVLISQSSACPFRSPTSRSSINGFGLFFPLINIVVIHECKLLAMTD